MAHELYRIKSRLCNTPHLIDATSFESIVEYLNDRNNGVVLDSALNRDNSESNSRYAYNKDVGVAVMNIDGPLSYKPITLMGFDCGGTSYQQLKEDFTYLVEDGVKTIAFSVSSGGGEAFQMMPTGDYIRKLADDNGVTILAFVDGISASAAYGLSVIADEIIMAPSSEVGSIGVLVRLMNDSKALEKEGYERTFVTAGEQKIPFDADGSFRKEFLEDVQSKVDTLYTEFTEYVAKHRNLSVEVVRSTQARTFLPEKALELGLADKVMTLEGFYSYLADVAQSEDRMLKSKLFYKTSTDEVEMNKLEEMQAELASVSAQFETAQVELTKVLALVEEKETALAAALEQVAKFEAAAAEAAAQAEQLKAEKRKEKLSAVLPAEKAESMFAKLSVLDDESFDEVVTGFAEAKAAVDASDLMSEVGISGEGDAPAQEDAGLSLVAELIAKQKKNK